MMKLDHLLRDRYFILQTDSKILSHMNVDHKDKVKRWKIAIQHFNFDVLHIEGEKNVEADALSRLVPFPTKQDQPMKLNNLEQRNIIERHEYLSKKIFKKIQQAHNIQELNYNVRTRPPVLYFFGKVLFKKVLLLLLLIMFFVFV